MLIKGDRYAYDAPDDAEIAPPPIDWAHRAARGIICNLTDRKAIKRGFEEIDEEIRVEIVDSMADIIRAASPPAPGAEVGPVAGLRYRSLEYDDWGMIRNADDSLFAVIRRPLGEDEAGAHRNAKTDPFEPLARVLMSALSSPPTTDAIRAQARREALEEAERSIKRLKGTLSYIAAQAKAGYPTALSVIRANAESALDDEWQKTVSEAQALLSKKVDDQ
jgi:hypothetical protein